MDRMDVIAAMGSAPPDSVAPLLIVLAVSAATLAALWILLNHTNHTNNHWSDK